MWEPNSKLNQFLHLWCLLNDFCTLVLLRQDNNFWRHVASCYWMPSSRQTRKHCSSNHICSYKLVSYTWQFFQMQTCCKVNLKCYFNYLSTIKAFGIPLQWRSLTRSKVFYTFLYLILFSLPDSKKIAYGIAWKKSCSAPIFLSPVLSNTHTNMSHMYK